MREDNREKPKKTFKHWSETPKQLFKSCKRRVPNCPLPALEARTCSEESVTIQGYGFEITLKVDGTFFITDTSGG